MLPVAVQFHAFVLMGLTGMGLAVLFDFARLGHPLSRSGRLAHAAGGIVLGIVGSCFAALGLYLAGWGEIRLYDVVAGGLGMWVYFALASVTVRWAGERAARRLHGTWRYGARMVARALFPLRRLFSHK